MAYRRAERPLDPNAVATANQQLWSQFPELKGRQLTPDDDIKYRSYWMDQYEKAGGAVQKPKPLPPKAPTQPCPKCDASVTIRRVVRGNPYVPRNAPDAGMPDSVPPTKTYDVEVVVTPSLEACPGQYIELSIINVGAENGTATVSPARITKTTIVTVTGGHQTQPGHGGQLKIQAKLDGAAVKAESLGFTVCAHPINYRDTFAADVDEHAPPNRVGVVVQDGWDSDSGTFADLDQAWDSEVVEYDVPTSPPFHAGGGYDNSDYQRANVLTQDRHRIRRPTAGPAASWERRQVCKFKCDRCGATDKVHPNSGFKIIHSVFLDSGHWKHHVRKFGAAVTAGAYTSEAGTADVTSPDHLLP
jgi:hypothetical protein